MQYLSDIISNDEINSWKNGDTIVINSPTGSGKTTFILSALLPKAIQEGKHILYLCNRKILDEQVNVSSQNKLREIFNVPEELTEEQSNYIHIVTYQYCEKAKRFPNLTFFSADGRMKLETHEWNTLYFIYDEAHYFLSDALFNSGTNMWLERTPLDNAINIFITATSEPVKWFLAFSNLNSMEKHMIAGGHLKPDIVKLSKDIYEKIHARNNFRKKLEYNRYREYCPVDLQEKEKLDVVSTKQYTYRDISEICRQTKVYSDTLITIKNAAAMSSPYRILPETAIPNSYNQLDEYYFHKLEDLVTPISSCPPDEKWLIFVSNVEDGSAFCTHLKSLGINAIFLSRNLANKNGKARAEFQQIAEEQKFSCKVLVSTSIMDCGVSIHDPDLKHIAISHSSKTTFLQMVGRKRLDEGETVKLYIMMQTGAHINGLRHMLENRMTVLCRFMLVDTRKYSSGYTTTSHPYLTSSEIDQLKDNLASDIGGILTYRTTDYNNSPKTEEFKFMDGRKASHTAFLAIMYELSEYISALDEYYECQDPYFYLKRQLAWINKEYDEQRWLFYDEATHQIAEFLGRYCSTIDDKCSILWIMHCDQDTFSRECLKLLLNLPGAPSNLKKCVDRFGAIKKPPGMSLLNKALKALNLPYRISSKSRTVAKGKRETCWRVEQVE